MIAIDAVQRVIVLAKKYVGFLCVPVFVLAAFIYLSSTHPSYKVTAKVALKDISTQSLVADMRSSSLIRKVIDRLQLQASYYNESSPRDELSPEVLKARLDFDGPAALNGETWIRLIADSADVVGLNHVDTTAWYEFNKPVHESYGNFKIAHGPGRKQGSVTYLVRLQGRNDLISQYSDNLNVEANNANGSVTMSVLAGTPKKGVEFLNELLYLQRTDKHASRYAGVSDGHMAVLQKPEDSIELASVGQFWIYLGAAMLGLLVPAGLNRLTLNRKKRPVHLKLPVIHGLINRIQQRFVVRQLD